MKILVIGGGGREHTLVWSINQSPTVDKIYCAPGNAGISELAECIDIKPTDISGLADFALKNRVHLTVVGPEAPLAQGIVDLFEEQELKVFGPNKKAANIEASKSFAKHVMNKHNIPTGEARAFSEVNEARAYIQNQTLPLVVKADGLAAGKGVMIANDLETAFKAIDDCFIRNKFGEAGKKVIIEEYLEGEELSLLAFTDGETVLPMVPAQDYKRIYEGDKGPNTGGMGSYSPVPAVDGATYQKIVEKILKPTIFGLASEGIRYKGVLYGGIILTSDGPKVLEFNVRFGDPETQAMLPRFQGDLVEVMLATVEERLGGIELSWTDEKCITVVVASSGYPVKYEKGFEIQGLDKTSKLGDVEIFHAGTAKEDGKTVTDGGRVLSISALGESFSSARDKAYAASKEIHFKGAYYRRDIALKAVKSNSRNKNTGLSTSEYLLSHESPPFG